MDSIVCPKPEFEQLPKGDYDNAVRCLGEASPFFHDLRRYLEVASNGDDDSPAGQMLVSLDELRTRVYAARGYLEFHTYTCVDAVDVGPH